MFLSSCVAALTPHFSALTLILDDFKILGLLFLFLTLSLVLSVFLALSLSLLIALYLTIYFGWP